MEIIEYSGMPRIERWSLEGSEGVVVDCTFHGSSITIHGEERPWTKDTGRFVTQGMLMDHAPCPRYFAERVVRQIKQRRVLGDRAKQHEQR